MENRIIYQLPGKPVAILIPCERTLTLEQIGQKDVPKGVQFWIVGADAIPTDRTFRAAWELDAHKLGVPSGIGGAE